MLLHLVVHHKSAYYAIGPYLVFFCVDHVLPKVVLLLSIYYVSQKGNHADHYHHLYMLLTFSLFFLSSVTCLRP